MKIIVTVIISFLIIAFIFCRTAKQNEVEEENFGKK